LKLLTITGLSLVLTIHSLFAQISRQHFNSNNTGFIENKGQIVDQNFQPNPEVLYLLNTPGFNVQLRKDGWSYDLYAPKSTEGDFIYPNPGQEGDSVLNWLHRVPLHSGFQFSILNFHRINFDLIGCNPAYEIVTSGPSADYLNYYTAGTPVGGVTFVRYFQKVIYKNIYPHVDLEFVMDEELGFKYNFVIYPGGKLEDIQLSIKGADVEVTTDGSLLLNTEISVIEEKIPKSYFLKHGMTDDVNVWFLDRENNIVGFSLSGKESPTSTLVIDPVPRRLWATYYGGEINESPGGCAIDTTGNLAIAGNTTSLTNIATAGAYQTTLLGNEDAFLARFTPDGQREWGTYYGGTDEESNFACCTDHSGKIYISGRTMSSTNISTPGSHQPIKGGWHYDCYLAKFSETGQLIWATYYGGSNTDDQGFCCTDDSLNVYLTGKTLSPNNISTPGSHQPALCGIQIDAFLAKFDSNGVRLWGTYYGGDEMDLGYACSASPNFNVFLTGDTHSQNNISTPGSHQPSYGGGPYDVFLVNFTPNGQRLWGTYYGGTLWDIYPSCATTSDGSVYLGGITNSQENISTPGSHQPVFAGAQDAFLAKFSSSGNREWGTYFGGADQDHQDFIAVDTTNNVYIAGNTNSSANIATSNAFQDSIRGSYDAFLAKFDPAGARLWGTYYGDTAYDACQSIAIGYCGHQFLYGWTESLNNISTPGSHQPVFGGGNRDNFIVKFAECTPPDTAGPINGPESICQNSDSIMYVVSSIQFATGYHWTVPSGTIILSGQNTTTIYVNFGDSATSGNISVYGFNCCENGVPDSVYIHVYPRPDPGITGNDTACSGGTSIYQTEAENSIYLWGISPGGVIQSGGTTLDTSVTVIWNSTGANWVQVNYIDTNGCEALTPAQKDVWVEQGDTIEVNITATGDTICAGTWVTFSASSMNAGTNPLFQWFINGVDTNHSDSILTYLPSRTDTLYCVVTSIETCRLNNPDTSNILITQVKPYVPVAVTITPSSNPVCEGDSVTFTSTPVNGGSNPQYQWLVNGITAGTNSPVFSFLPQNGDSVGCMLTSNETCTSNNPATSNPVLLQVNPLLPVSITISPSANPICEGLPVTFTGVALNGGSEPIFQWQVNGIPAGSYQPFYSYTPVHGDLITCTVTSSETCTSGNPATSNPVSMLVVEAPEVTFTPCFDTITATNAKPILLRGGIPLGGAYSGTGITVQPGEYGLRYSFNPSLAGPGTHQITYSYTNFANCEASATINVFNFPFSIFNCGDSLTDIRDNRKYPTIQLGSQCWLAANLNYGIQISGSQSQRDNCIPEKYCYNDIPALCALSSALYQWDELMRYEDSEEIQGLCPPGWHVPSETEWNQLFAFYQNNAFAGAPLKYTGYSGFNAFLNGAMLLNRDWYYPAFAAFFWSSTSHGPFKAWAHGLNEYNYSVSFYPALRSNAFSVRCLMD